MSSFGGGGGGRTRMGTKVYLNLYDLSPMNDLLFPIGMGLHHTGVEILGSEYSFASGAGVFESTPKEAPGAKFREQIDMGSFEGGTAQLNIAMSELRETFGPDEYNLIQRNCNHFANALCWKLLNKRIPGYVNRLADVGVCCSCLLPKKMLESAPVGDPNSASGSTGGAFMVKAPPGRTMGQSASSSTTKVFQGSGARLGGSGATGEERAGLLQRLKGSGTTSDSRQDDLVDRREKARKAALARLEKQQQTPTDSDKSQ